MFRCIHNINVLYSWAADTLYIKAYIKYKNKDKQCVFFGTVHFVNLLFPPQWKSLRPEEKNGSTGTRSSGLARSNDIRCSKAMSHTRNGHGKKCSIRSHRHVICMQQTRGEGLPLNFYTRLSGALYSTFLLCVNMTAILDCVTLDRTAQPALSLVKSQSLNYNCISILQFQIATGFSIRPRHLLFAPQNQ